MAAQFVTHMLSLILRSSVSSKHAEHMHQGLMREHMHQFLTCRLGISIEIPNLKRASKHVDHACTVRTR